MVRVRKRDGSARINPFTPKSGQFQSSPAASPGIWIKLLRVPVLPEPCQGFLRFEWAFDISGRLLWIHVFNFFSFIHFSFLVVFQWFEWARVVCWTQAPHGRLRRGRLWQISSAVKVVCVCCVCFRPTPRKYAFLPCGHLDFESAVTSQNDEFKAGFIASIHACWTSKASQEAQYSIARLSPLCMAMATNAENGSFRLRLNHLRLHA